MESNKNQGNNLPPGSAGVPPAQTNEPPPEQAATPAVNQRFRLEPLGFGQLFDLTLKLYAGNFKYLMCIVAICMSPVLTMHILALMSHFTSYNTYFSAAGPPHFLLVLICSLIARGAVTLIVSDIYMNTKRQPKQVLRAVKARFWRLIRGGILFRVGLYICFALPIFLYLIVSKPGARSSNSHLILAIAMIFFGIHTFKLFTHFLLYPMAIMIENKSVIKAFVRSMALVKGSWKKIAGVWLLCSLVTELPRILSFAHSMGMLFGKGGAAQTVPVVQLILQTTGVFVDCAIAPVLDIAIVLFYYDLRVRKEGLDLEMLAKEIG